MSRTKPRLAWGVNAEVSDPENNDKRISHKLSSGENICRKIILLSDVSEVHT